MKEFQQELRLDPSDASAAYELGEASRSAGQLEEAGTYFEQALKFYPDFEEAHLGLAAVLMSQSEPKLALPHLQKAGDDQFPRTKWLGTGCHELRKLWGMMPCNKRRCPNFSGCTRKRFNNRA